MRKRWQIKAELARQNMVAFQKHTNGKKSRSSDDNQGQPQFRVTRNIFSDVADPRSSKETKSEDNKEGTWLGTKMCAGLAFIDQARIKGKNWSFNILKLTSV